MQGPGAEKPKRAPGNPGVARGSIYRTALEQGIYTPTPEVCPDLAVPFASGPHSGSPDSKHTVLQFSRCTQQRTISTVLTLVACVAWASVPRPPKTLCRPRREPLWCGKGTLRCNGYFRGPIRKSQAWPSTLNGALSRVTHNELLPPSALATY